MAGKGSRWSNLTIAGGLAALIILSIALSPAATPGESTPLAETPTPETPETPGGFGTKGAAAKSASKKPITQEDAVELNVHMKLAIKAMEEPDYEAAQRHLSAAYEIQADNDQVNFMLGIMNLHTDPENKQGRVDAAIPLFEAVVENDPKHVDAHYNLAAALYTQSLENMDDVTETLKALFALDPQHKKGRLLATHLGLELHGDALHEQSQTTTTKPPARRQQPMSYG